MGFPTLAFDSGRGDRTRTCNLRFWRPLLYQLNYAPSRINLKAAPRRNAICVPVQRKATLSDTHHLEQTSAYPRRIPTTADTALPHSNGTNTHRHGLRAAIEPSANTECPPKFFAQQDAQDLYAFSEPPAASCRQHLFG